MTLKKRRAAKPERFAKTRSYVGFDLASSPARTVRYELDQGGHVTSWCEIPPRRPIGSGKTVMQANDILLRECAQFRERMRGVRIPFWRRVFTDLWWIRWNIGLWFLRLCRRIGRIFT